MKIETKYDIGDEVYYIEDGKIKKSQISGVDISAKEIKDLFVPKKPKLFNLETITYYIISFGVTKVMLENEIFKTKEDLIKSLMEE